jgi:two-component system, cell cycle sensor histidine kinase and response regulator CckA
VESSLEAVMEKKDLLHGARVVIVEDDMHTLALFRKSLTSAGVEVFEASTAAGALRCIEANPVDLLVLDLELAGGEKGEDLLRTLEERNIELPTVVVSAHSDFSRVRHLLPYRIHSYHVKDRETFLNLRDIVASALETKRLTTRLAETEDILRATFANAPNPIAIFDVGGRKVEAMNVELRRLLAATDGNDGEALALIARLVEETPARGIAVRTIEAGARSLTLELSNTEFIRAGKTYRVVNFRDVTELERQRKRLQSLYDASSEGIVVIDFDNLRYVECNSSFAALVGKKREALIGSLAEEFRDDDGPVLSRILANRPVSGGDVFAFESQLLRADGESVPISVRMGLSNLEGRAQLHAFVHDMSEARGVERELQQTRSRMQTFLSKSHLLCIVTNGEGEIEEWNAGAERALGYPREQVIGSAVWELVHPKARDSAREQFFELIRNAEDVGRWILSHRAASGEIVMIEWNHTIVRDGSFGPTGLAFFGSVVTEQREAEFRARILFEESLSGIILIDEKTGWILDVNPEAAGFFGREVNELKGTHFFRHIAAADRPVVKAKLEALRTQGAVRVDGRALALRSNGTTFDFGYRGSRIVVAGRTFIVIMGRDITETQRAETRFQEMFTRSFEPIVIAVAGTTDIIECNPAFERLVGRSREELLTMRLLDLREPVERERIQKMIDSAGDEPEGTMHDYESVLLRSDGTRVQVAFRTAKVNFGGRFAYISYIRDVTAERVAKARYEEIFRRSGDPIVVIDRREERIVDCNPALARLVGLPVESILGRNWSQLSDAEAADLSRQRTTLRTADGVEVPVEMHASDLDLFGGQEQRIITMTDLRPAEREEELERSLTQAQKMQSLGQMASGIAHDFNNTLMSALPWADLIRRKYPNEEVIQKSADQIRRAVHRAKDVTRQLLDFAQPKRPQSRLIRLAEVVSEQLRLIRPAIPPEIEIETDLDESITVNADPAQIGQVLLNLALNARDAMTAGGKLSITLSADDHAGTSRGLAAGGRVATLSVCDTGEGIPSESIQKIFDPFYTTKDIGKGTGLGLSVVHRIVEQHHGHIFVDSEVGKGTTFTILLPRPADRTVGDGEMEVAEIDYGFLRGRSILIIDDEEMVSEGIRVFLELEGANVNVADRGEKAIELLRGGYRPDAIILDLGLPEMTGDSVHGHIRNILPSVPIVISSGYGERSRIDPLLDGRTRFKQKPYEIDELLREVRLGWETN